jgi:hypothetical protein
MVEFKHGCTRHEVRLHKHNKITRSYHEFDMHVENSECEVTLAGAEPWKVRVSSNQSAGIPPSRESQVAKHGGPIRAGHRGFAGGLAEQLIAMSPKLR